MPITGLSRYLPTVQLCLRKINCLRQPLFPVVSQSWSLIKGKLQGILTRKIKYAFKSVAKTTKKAFQLSLKFLKNTHISVKKGSVISEYLLKRQREPQLFGHKTEHKEVDLHHVLYDRKYSKKPEHCDVLETRLCFGWF